MLTVIPFIYKMSMYNSYSYMYVLIYVNKVRKKIWREIQQIQNYGYPRRGAWKWDSTDGQEGILVLSIIFEFLIRKYFCICSVTGKNCPIVGHLGDFSDFAIRNKRF